ncbi:MAG TPA: cohesin domain-containing protein [Verrucomicrobiae bacterium]|nr:cohesin domain-containing protein [Verrucomicrobiae bacterium]
MDAVKYIVLATLLGAIHLPAQTSLSIGSQPAFPGATVNVPVNLTRATNVVAAQFDVTFDPSRASSGPAVGDARQTVVSREVAPGVRRVLVFSRQNTVITNRTPLVMPFTVSPTEYTGSGPLTPVNAVLARANATTLTPVSLSSGTIFVRPVNRLADGHVQFFLPATPDQRYFIQASSDLQQWINISTNVATGSFMDLIDVDAPGYPYRFYRWQLAP